MVIKVNKNVYLALHCHQLVRLQFNFQLIITMGALNSTYRYKIRDHIWLLWNCIGINLRFVLTVTVLKLLFETVWNSNHIPRKECTFQIKLTLQIPLTLPIELPLLFWNYTPIICAFQPTSKMLFVYWIIAGMIIASMRL